MQHSHRAGIAAFVPELASLKPTAVFPVTSPAQPLLITVGMNMHYVSPYPHLFLSIKKPVFWEAGGFLLGNNPLELLPPALAAQASGTRVQVCVCGGGHEITGVVTEVGVLAKN